MEVYIYCARKGLQTRIGLQKSEACCNQIRNQILLLERISNPGAIHQNGMQSGFCYPAIAILMMPDWNRMHIILLRAMCAFKTMLAP